jgi:hypothetical protein
MATSHLDRIIEIAKIRSRTIGAIKLPVARIVNLVRFLDNVFPIFGHDIESPQVNDHCYVT